MGNPTLGTGRLLMQYARSPWNMIMHASGMPKLQEQREIEAHNSIVVRATQTTSKIAVV